MSKEDTTTELHPSVIPELEEIEALFLLMLSDGMNSMPVASRRNLFSLGLRVASAARAKAQSQLLP